MANSNFQTIFPDLSPIASKRYAAQSLVFCQDDGANHIFVVKSGQVILERSSIQGKSVVLYTANSGDSFAEASLFASHYHCNAIAVQTSDILFFSKEAILKRLAKQPDKAMQYIAFLSAQIRELRSSLEIRNIQSSEERIVRFLMLHITPHRQEYWLEKSLKDLARELGLAHETLYRTLAKLEKAGFIERTSQTLKLLKVPDF